MSVSSPRRGVPHAPARLLSVVWTVVLRKCFPIFEIRAGNVKEEPCSSNASDTPPLQIASLFVRYHTMLHWVSIEMYKVTLSGNWSEGIYLQCHNMFVLYQIFPETGKRNEIFVSLISLRNAYLCGFFLWTHFILKRIFFLEAFFGLTHFFEERICLLDVVFCVKHFFVGHKKMHPATKCVLEKMWSAKIMRHKEMRPAKNVSHDIFQVQGSVVQKTP